MLMIEQMIETKAWKKSGNLLEILFSANCVKNGEAVQHLLAGCKMLASISGKNVWQNITEHIWSWLLFGQKN